MGDAELHALSAGKRQGGRPFYVQSAALPHTWDIQGLLSASVLRATSSWIIIPFLQVGSEQLKETAPALAFGGRRVPQGPPPNSRAVRRTGHSSPRVPPPEGVQVPGSHLYVGRLQKEAGVFLQDLQQRQGYHAAEADGQKPRFFLQVQRWPQLTVGNKAGRAGASVRRAPASHGGLRWLRSLALPRRALTPDVSHLTVLRGAKPEL